MHDDAELPSFDEAVASGATSSSSSQAGGFRTTFACMTRFNQDRLHFVDFPRSEVETVTARIQAVWPKGIQDSKRMATPGGWDVKIGGLPWAAVQCGPADGRVLLGEILEHLYNRGWVLHTSIAAFQHTFYGDTLMFRHQMPPPPPCDWLVVAFEKSDRLKIMPAPPDDLRASLLRWLGSQVQKSSSERDCAKDGFMEIKLNGQPWSAMSDQGVRTHLVLLKLLDAFQTTGFALYGSMRQQQLLTQDMLVVHRQKDWKPGQPVWQR
ncbi:hypothetical protein GE09DRAFT_386688 [Coniochaeta sp. 2T2.1]|nr:hypothetical protein GE09DRAFT_386688 [Coniochaeta sp. 2T2.1]